MTKAMASLDRQHVEMKILGEIAMFTKAGVFFLYKRYDLGPKKVFTVHSRGVFTQDKSGYFSNSKEYGRNGTGKKCSL